MSELEERQAELGGVVFGDLTPVQLGSDGIQVSDTEMRLGDRDTPGADGAQFGIDYQDGRTVSMDLWTDTHTGAEARQALAVLRREWSADTARATSRAVVPLRFRMPDCDTVVVYGRPRRWTPGSQRTRDLGVVDVVADFRTADRLFYSDVERSIQLSLVTSGGGGITWPIVWPVTWAPSGRSRQDAAVNWGDSPTWPVITISGPVAQPEVEFLGTDRRVRLDMSIPHDRTISIDTRPWARTVLRDDGASFAGQLRGAMLADLQLPVGQTTVAYRGTDLSGQSVCTISWRDATETP